MEHIIGVSPTAFLGNGYDVDAFQEGMNRGPHFIGVDAGSIDPGPYYLGTATPLTPADQVKRDLTPLVIAARQRSIPLIVGSAIGNGTKSQLDLAAEIVREIARENGLSFRLALINAELDQQYVKNKNLAGDIELLDYEKVLTEGDIERSTHIVAQMGVEPIIEALEQGADIVLAGRCCDDAIFAALPIKEGFDPGLSLHMGKILECAALSAVPLDKKAPLRSPMFGYVYHDHFLVEPASQSWVATVTSVAAHTLYEREDPLIQPGPGGINDLRETAFEQVNDRTVKITGSKFTRDTAYKVKIEGAAKVGHRTICIVGIRDPFLIREISHVVEHVSHKIIDRFEMLQEAPEQFHLFFHIYGKNAVMGSLEPQKEITGHEIAVLIEAIAPTEEVSGSMCAHARSSLGHAFYEGQKATSGNIAYPFSPFTVSAGEAYEFSIHHLLRLEDACECFDLSISSIPE